MLSLTYHSNKIEGSTLSENETGDIIFRNLTLPHHSLTEHLEAKNHQVALDYLFSRMADSGQIDETFILKLHGILMNGVRPDAGLYRQHGVRIVGAYVPTANYLKVSRLMAGWFLEVNKPTSDVIAKVARTHASFEQIHPFADGNGRIGRLLALAILLKNNYAPAIIRQENKRRYYLYLNQAQLKNSFSHLEDFFCDAVLDGFEIVENG
jgi:Fic family protein